MADGAFCSVEFIEGIRKKLGHHGVIGVRKDRRLQGDEGEGTNLNQLASSSSSQGKKKKKKKQVGLEGLDVPVYVASFWLKGEGSSKKERRFSCSLPKP